MSISSHSRRDFMIAGGAALAGMTLASRAARAASAEELKLGLIGCGGRGTGAMQNALLADPNTRLVAMADGFADRIEESLKSLKKGPAKDRVSVDDGGKFSGLDGYKKLLEMCDVVVLAAPPAFRPAHLKAVVDAGKHCFCEKPVAVDGPGLRAVRATCEEAAKKGLNVVSGLCYRYENKKRETIKRVQDGAVGDIVTIETVYNTSGLWHRGDKKEWSRLEYQLRNWIYFDWLSGDHIVEQHIHSLDKMMWVMGDAPPVKATASGGRTVRTDAKYGNVWDHFNTVFEWENGVRAFSSCRQWENAVTAVYDNVYGTKGTAKIQEHTILPAGGDAWKWSSEEPDDMYQNELDALFRAIRAGEVINNGDYMVKSNAAAVMARMAAYSGQTVTWGQCMNSDLALVPEDLQFGDLEANPVPVPGQKGRRYF